MLMIGQHKEAELRLIGPKLLLLLLTETLILMGMLVLDHHVLPNLLILSTPPHGKLRDLMLKVETDFDGFNLSL
jgi:hypothetical protein